MTGHPSSAEALRVMVIHRYYWPDSPPYARLLRAIVRRWTDAGHQVDVLTAQPSYKPESRLAPRPRTERVDEATVRRIAMRPDRSSKSRRLFNVVWFPIAVAVRILLGRGHDLVMCSTAPPVLLGWAVSLATRLRRQRFVYHCMDIHPEIGALSGDFANPVLYRLLRRMDLAACQRAAALIVLSQDMRASLLARDPLLEPRIHVLNNVDLPSFDDDPTSAGPLPLETGRLRVAFTGNLGRFQALEVIARAALAPDPRLKPLQLVFMGEGAAKRELEALVAAGSTGDDDRVVFVPHGSPAEARALLRSSSVGLVSLSPGVINFAYPSKTSTYLSEGLPVLVAVERNSELASMVETAGIGAWLDVRDESAVRDVLAAWVERRRDLGSMAQRARQVWQDNFSADNILPGWDNLLETIRTTGQCPQPRQTAGGSRVVS